jgi:RNA polymerase sigma-70 factor (ECF subfamily)
LLTIRWVVGRALGRYDPARGSAEAWLWRIVVNLARDSGRAAGRWAMAWERLVAGGAVESQAEPVESLVMRRLRDAELLDAIRSLARRHRTLIGLRFGAGLTYAAIAAQLGQSEATVKQATYRALASLRRRLEETPR